MSSADNAADILQSYFERSASVVHGAFRRIEKTYIGPVVGHVSRSFQSRPIFSAFLAFFFALSFLPTLSFIGFSFFTYGILTFLALAGSFLASIVVIGFAGFLLACTLAVLFLVASVLTGSALIFFLAFRLLTLVRMDGPRAGISEWTSETKTRLYQGSTAVTTVHPDASGPQVEDDRLRDDDDDSHSNTSVGSTVVVNSGTDSGGPGKDFAAVVKEEPL